MSSVHSAAATAALLAIFLSAGSASASPNPPADNTAKLAATAAPMKRDALERLYANRTWLWGKNGAGFFSINGNGRKRFVARTNTGYGQGDWYVTGGGKLCMRARWGARNERDSGAITCFLHRERDGVVYQRPALGGEWYVFRNNPVGKNDEARKLVKGDRVSQEKAPL